MTQASNDRLDLQPLAGQVALVTGGGRGLGRAMAQALAHAGMAIAVAARTTSEVEETVALIERENGKALAFTLSVTDEAAVQQMASEVEHQLGPVDLLINNAGVVTPFGPLWEVDAEEWWRCLDINLRGTFLCTRAVLPSMERRKCGRILNLASGAGLVGIPYGSAYVISKTALIRFTENLALETKELGISTFAVEPGTIRTAMSEYVYSSDAGQKWAPWFRKIFDKGLDVPMERLTDLVLALASGQADVLSGCTISVEDDLPTLVSRVVEVTQHELYTLRLPKLMDNSNKYGT